VTGETIGGHGVAAGAVMGIGELRLYAGGQNLCTLVGEPQCNGSARSKVGILDLETVFAGCPSRASARRRALLQAGKFFVKHDIPSRHACTAWLG